MGIFRSIMTSRVIGLFLLALVGSSCLGQGEDQLHGMFDLGFPSTAVCNAQPKFMTFRNVSDSTIIIEGAAISAGTDPLGNFELVSVVIGREEIPSVNGVLNEISVPVGASYTFNVTYLPKTENTAHTAMLDIAYKEPKEGIIQVALSGTSAGRANTCPTQVPGGPVLFDGEVTITIEKLIVINGANSALPIRSDQHIPSDPFIPPDLPLTLDLTNGTALLPKIDPEDNFVLHPPDPAQVPALASLIKHNTFITSFGDASGTYDAETGEVGLEALSVHLDNPQDIFAADLIIDVTTGEVDFTSTGISSGDIGRGDFLIIGNAVAGTPLQADTGKIVLVGISAFTNGFGKLGDIINNRPAILRIEATVQDPTPDAP